MRRAASAPARSWASLGAMMMCLSGCSMVGMPGDGSVPPPAGAPDHRRDRPPSEPVDVDLDAIPDAQPRQERKSRRGNGARYEVYGRTYRVLGTSRGFQEEGVASWYGEEFHGRATASGEPYDMFSMSAAHRTLPLPTYLEVTNLDNGRTVVVRVNDRGPFVDDRILDLSYAAAWRLGLVETGTARVSIRALDPPAR